MKAQSSSSHSASIQQFFHLTWSTHLVVLLLLVTSIRPSRAACSIDIHEQNNCFNQKEGNSYDVQTNDFKLFRHAGADNPRFGGYGTIGGHHGQYVDPPAGTSTSSECIKDGDTIYCRF